MKRLLWAALLCAWPAIAQAPAPVTADQAAKEQLALADRLLAQGDRQKALEAYRVTRQLFAAAGSLGGQGHALLGEARILFLLEEHRRALELYEEARPLFQAGGNPAGLGSTWEGESDILFALGENQKALDGFRYARELYRAARSGIGQGNTWNREAGVLFLTGESERSLAAYRTARPFFQAEGEPIGEANSWAGEARILRLRGQWKEAAAAAAAASAGYLKAGDVQGRLAAILLEAEAQDGLGDGAAAARSAGEAIRLQSEWRKTWITARSRAEEDERLSTAYDILVSAHASQAGQEAEALRLAEEARSRVLLDLLATPPDRGETVPAVDLMAERLRLEAGIWQAEQDLRGSPEPARQAEIRARRQRLDQELEWNRYQRIAAQEESFSAAPPLDGAAIQALADQAGPLLLYYGSRRWLWGFLVLPGTKEIVLRRIDLTLEDREDEVRAFAHDLANPMYEARAEPRARRLWDLLIAPFADRIPAGARLVLVPHGPLHELPFEALIDPAGHPLFERWQVSAAPSASALEFARRRHVPPAPKDSFLALSSGQGLSLPAAEAAEISGFFGSNKAAFRPTEARYETYEKLVTQARQLLIATRGVYTEGSRTETYLEIQPTPEVHDSRLTVAEIATIPLQAELVTLAACDTSRGRALLSDERLDLTRSFLIARAAAVLATRWKVPEAAATSRFLADFYRAYRQGGPQGAGLRKDEALSAARRRSRERGDPAQVWAAWVLVGDAR